MPNDGIFCPLCNSELVNVYDSRESDTPALDLSDEERKYLEDKHAMLAEVLQHLNYAKKTRLISSIDLNEDLSIYVCMMCRKVYDTYMLQFQDVGHGDGNTLPFKKIEEHSIISADQESIDNAVSAQSKQELFTSQKKADYLLKTHKQGTKFANNAKLKTLDNIAYAKGIKEFVEKVGTKNVKVNIKI